MKNKVLIKGVDAQGSTTTKRLNEEEAIEEIRCADRDHKALDELTSRLKKARGVTINA